MIASLQIWIVFGTRPEYIKLAPVIKWLLDNSDFQLRVIHTGQHETLGIDTGVFFGVSPDVQFSFGTRDRISLSTFHQALRNALNTEINQFGAPSFLIVQGDTLSAFTAAETGFMNGIPVLHVEAGLRTRNMQEPWPEEILRVLITRFSTWHFAPTESARHNLLREGISSNRILVTGNTIVDAFHYIQKSQPELFLDVQRSEPRIKENTQRNPSEDKRSFTSDTQTKNVLLTLHRRENEEQEQLSIANSLKTYLKNHPHCQLTVIRHPNPSTWFLIHEIQNEPQVTIMEALRYPDFLKLMSQMDLILTDSGGLQEEAPIIGIPVVVLRNVTERPEVVSSDYGTLTGSDPERIGNAIDYHLSRGKLLPTSLFGDGQTSRRTGELLLNLAKGSGK